MKKSEEKKLEKAKKWIDSLDDASKERLLIYLKKRIEELKTQYNQNLNKNKNIENPYKDDKIIKTNEKRIEDLKTQYKQLTNNNEKAMIMDLIQSLQNEIGQFNENKYAWRCMATNW